MPRTVRGPDGKLHRFPDGVTDEQIAVALGVAPAPKDLPTRALETVGGVVAGLGQSAQGAIEGAGALGSAMLQPSWTEGGMEARRAIGEGLVGMHTDLYKKAAAASREGETPASLGYRAASAVPIVGPMVASYVEQAAAGEAPEAVGRAVGDVALGRLTSKAPGQLSRYTTARPTRLDATAYRRLTEVLRPSNKDFHFERDLASAVDEIAEQARLEKLDPKNPIPTVSEFGRLTQEARKRMRNTYEQYVSPFRPVIVIDGKTAIAPAIRRTVTSKMRRESPSQAAALDTLAKRYESDIPLAEAEALLEETNNRLNSFYKKDRFGQATRAEEQTAARDIAIAKAIRKEMYSKLDAMAGPGIAEVQRRYGALRSIEGYAEPVASEVSRYGGKNLPAMASETAADVAAGGIYSRAGALVRGGRGLVRMIIPDANEQVAKAFRRLGRLQANTPRPAPRTPVAALPPGAIRAGAPIGPTVPAQTGPGMIVHPGTRASRTGRMLPAAGESTIIREAGALQPTDLESLMAQRTREFPRPTVSGPPARRYDATQLGPTQRTFSGPELWEGELRFGPTGEPFLVRPEALNPRPATSLRQLLERRSRPYELPSATPRPRSLRERLEEWRQWGGLPPNP